jgi:hypothetical protein
MSASVTIDPSSLKRELPIFESKKLFMLTEVIVVTSSTKEIKSLKVSI